MLGLGGQGQALPSAVAPTPNSGLRAEPSLKQTASLCSSDSTPILPESAFHHPLITDASHSLRLSVHTQQPLGPGGGEGAGQTGRQVDS